MPVYTTFKVVIGHKCRGLYVKGGQWARGQRSVVTLHPCVGSRLTAGTDICQLFVSWYLYCLDFQTNHTLDIHGLLGNVRPVVSPADGH
jgi:hypothetical protein